MQTNKQNRVGAPNKPHDLVKIPVGYKLPRWLVEWMREQSEAQPILIETALKNYYNLDEPPDGTSGKDMEKEE